MRAADSKSRTRAAGSMRAFVSKTQLRVRVLQKAVGRARPRRRRRSPAIFSILFEIGQQLLKCEPRNRLALWRPIGAADCGTDPALADAAFAPGFCFLSRRID